MKTGIIFVALISLFGSSAFASEWNYFLTVSREDKEYFFDAESVEKTKDTVTLWVKIIQKYKPDADDGSWSTAVQWRMNCQKRTIQFLTFSTYNSDGKFIKSNSTIGQEKSWIPDSIGDWIAKTACMADFPKNTPATKNSYVKIDDNDIFRATKSLVEAERSRTDNAPK